MSTLVISDHFYNIREGNYKYIEWDKAEDLDPREHVNILVDIRFHLQDMTDSKRKLLRKVKEDILERNFLKAYRRNIVIIYGENGLVDYEVPYDSSDENSELLQEDFEIIEIVRNLFDEDDRESVKENIGQNIISKAPDPIDTYLRKYTCQNTCLYFDYTGSSKIHNIVPFATINDEDDDLVAFEYKYGKSNIIIIPPYDLNQKVDVFDQLNDVFDSYNETAHLLDIIKLLKRKFTGNEVILKNITELEMAFRNRLYVSTILICGRILDWILPEDDNCPITLQTLGTKLRWYNGQKMGQKVIDSDKIIDDRLYNLGKEFVEFRNAAAHTGRYSKDNLKHSDAKDAIESINIFVTNFNYIDQKLNDYRRTKHINKEGRR